MTGLNSVGLGENLKKHLSFSDLVFGNLEGPVTTAPARVDKNRPLHMAPSTGFSEDNLGISAVVLANNHIMDHGAQGLDDTIKFLKQLNIPYAGAGNNIQDALRPLSIKTNGVRLAVLAFCHEEGPMASDCSPGPCPLPDAKILCRLIEDLKAEHDLVILSYHGGEEFFTIPWQTRIKMFHEFVNVGANIVYGHHAHVTQGFECFKDSLILYGVGNFYMDTIYQRANPESQFGAVFEIEVTDKLQNFEISYIPIHANLEHKIVEIANPEDANIIDDTISLSCRSLVDSSLYAAEWNCQAAKRFIGRFGFFGTAYRMLRFYRNRRLYKKGTLFSRKRDLDIFKGALNHFKSNLLRK
jgi:poly-gamma-glutamate synthesis protein (capsule biosynthesis protein)